MQTTLHNRDLSWLSFSLRILHEAANEKVPLYERLKFLAIFSSNLDEFFRVRYPAVVALTKLNAKTKAKAGVYDNESILPEMQEEINRQLKYYGAILAKQVLPALQQNNIHFYYDLPLASQHLAELKELFQTKVQPHIQPIWLQVGKSAQKFTPQNNQLYFVVTIRAADGLSMRYAIVNIPSNKLPRFYVLTPLHNKECVVFIDDVIRENLAAIFPGLEIVGVYSIKFNQDAELNLDDEFSLDLLNKIDRQLRKRDYAPPSRFLFEGHMPRNIQLYLAAMFSLQYEEMFSGGRYHNLSDLASFPSFNKGLQYHKQPELLISEMQSGQSVFTLLNNREILLHLPYHSYHPVLLFFSEAAVDISVTEIYITLYRVAADSHIVNSLITAAKNGKKVTVFVELKARFDEANNIRWSREMKNAGIKMIYSLPHIKVHSKIALVRRQSGDETNTYGIVSTGNFNEVTARFYTDHLLMTTDDTLLNELLRLFKFLQKEPTDTNTTRYQFYNLLVSQFNMVDKLDQLIDIEKQKMASGKKGIIRIKVNNLEEPGMIEKLYKASQAGVHVQCCVRGICCLAPGVQGISDHIKVKRLVDQYLEHSRLFIFGEDEEAVVLMGSADWMTRNLYHRIEVCVPIQNNALKKQLVNYFNIQWSDTDKAYEMLSDGTYQKVLLEGISTNAQNDIYAYLQNMPQAGGVPTAVEAV